MKPVFLVDGTMEQEIVKCLCPGTKVVRLDCNGRDVAIEVIGKRAASYINTLSGRYSPIIILIDRESRNASANNLAKQLDVAVKKDLKSKEDIRVHVVDRMIENWLLADEKNVFGKRIHKGSVDGVSGKSVVQAHFRGLGQAYRESTDGVALFRKIDFAVARRVSANFGVFAGLMKGICPKVSGP